MATQPHPQAKPEAAAHHAEAHDAPKTPTPPAETSKSWTPEPALDPHAQKPPAGVYADGMGIADEQRARSAWIEAHGDKAYHEAVDERTPEEKAPKQIPGVVPPTKRS